jgi:glutamyl-tRNA reductase
MWVMSVINLHIVLFWLSVGGAHGFTPGGKQMRTASACPFQRVTSFISQRTAAMRQPYEMLMGVGGIVQNMPDAAVLAMPFVCPSSSSNSGSGRYNSRYRSSRLCSTTVDAEVAAAMADPAKTDNDDPNKKKKKKKKRQDGLGPLEVVVLGLSHHKAKIDVREKLSIPEDQWNMAANVLCESPHIAEAAVLSTCNRFEVYLSGKNAYDAIGAATDFFQKRGNLDQVTLRDNLFMLSGEDAIWHLMRVSAGLDSLVVGEGQILSQVKRAYEHGEEQDGATGKVIARMLNTAVAAGKRVRSETGISRGAVSISSAAAEFTATKVRGDCNVEKMEDANITIIGAGKMARLLLVHLQTQGVKRVTIVNRSQPRVDQLREEFSDLDIQLCLMSDMWEVLADSDIVYSSTAAETTIINPDELRACMASRKRQGGLHLVDISVPRNVHGDCDELEGVASYNVDNLKEVVANNTAMRRKEMLAAEDILLEEMSKYRSWQQSLGAIPTIAALQEKAETLRLEEFEKASKKLQNLSAKDQEAVERLSKGIVAKLLHGPMNHLRQQTDGDDTIRAIDQVSRAFQLDPFQTSSH